MLDADRREFADAMNQLFAIYGDEVTVRMREAWWGVLSPYKLNAVMAAMSLHAGDVARGMFRPTPADIRRHLEETMPSMLKERRVAIIRDMREQIAPLQERIDLLRNDVRIRVRTREQALAEVQGLRQQIAQIQSSPEVIMALAPQAPLRDDEDTIGPRDRLPDVVRKAIGWLGKTRKKDSPA